MGRKASAASSVARTACRASRSGVRASNVRPSKNSPSVCGTRRSDFRVSSNHVLDARGIGSAVEHAEELGQVGVEHHELAQGHLASRWSLAASRWSLAVASHKGARSAGGHIAALSGVPLTLERGLLGLTTLPAALGKHPVHSNLQTNPYTFGDFAYAVVQ